MDTGTFAVFCEFKPLTTKLTKKYETASRAHLVSILLFTPE